MSKGELSKVDKEIAVMTPETARLVYRIRISTAASYLHFIEETDRNALLRWGIDYNTEDIRQWAKERIDEILASAREIKSQFDHNITLATSVQNVVARHVERLEQAGFQC